MDNNPANKLSYWMKKTGGRKNAAYTLLKRQQQAERRGGNVRNVTANPRVTNASTPTATSAPVKQEGTSNAGKVAAGVASAIIIGAAGFGQARRGQAKARALAKSADRSNARQAANEQRARQQARAASQAAATEARNAQARAGAQTAQGGALNQTNANYKPPTTAPAAETPKPKTASASRAENLARRARINLEIARSTGTVPEDKKLQNAGRRERGRNTTRSASGIERARGMVARRIQNARGRSFGFGRQGPSPESTTRGSLWGRASIRR